ncbi:bifunctional diaminohydroxyphosphoribosylaminopyrimidine deaminase/5-amino-6-(5-phosphoribosylamino)uracil reductase RibD [Candidatus Marinarcus aquaticus]|uniref:Riboflavin biosynthesis protein RibD n=1 Tax=Candidatus Marinarcus aquaticus TaxID=2044504 RepID=A0A4Q0XPP6_9BACT|nr:bifunctional diaminohydroxyphosphoribosylaminopyrimidine deaminase/5-amino-6-(5-phosphoribosylamino)uracil reductase RibD [Candidatus Marinarcus aquaticus]RXJ57709.1 riboflavin biosynthesis protein RibD [Candidatus Marinarcus aquaticus]
MRIDDNFYMKLAIDEAWKYQLLTYPNPAVGCVVVNNGEPLAIEAHKSAGESHAEVNALKAAYLKKNPNSPLKAISDPFKIHEFLKENHNGFFRDCTVYVTLEPCAHIGKTPSCATLLCELKPSKVIIAHEDMNKEASGGAQRLKEAQIEVSIGCMKKEAYELLYPFIKWCEGNFTFFKMAQTLNGTIDGGRISSNQAQAYVHTLRDKLDLLAIGGNTVRTDQPTLDARYVAGRAPNVLIYSRNKVFDKKIPLFYIPNREVIISDNIEDIKQYKLVMIEGGYSLLNELQDVVDYFIMIVSPTMKSGFNGVEGLDINFDIIHENYIGSDKIIYLKKKTSF